MEGRIKGLRGVIVSFLVMVLLGSVWVSSAWFIGWKVENKYRRLVKVLDEQAPFTVKIIDFKRGVFSSQAKVEITLDRWLKNQAIKWVMLTDFVHGPLVIDKIKVHCVQTLAEISILYLGKNVDLEPPVRAELKLSWGGRFKFRLKPTREFFTLAWGHAGTFCGETDFENFILNWKIPKFELKSPNHYLLKDFHVNVRTTYDKKLRLWLGDSMVRLAKGYAVDKRKTNVELSNFMLRANLDQAEKLVCRLTCGFDEFNLNHMIYKDVLAEFNLKLGSGGLAKEEYSKFLRRGSGKLGDGFRYEEFLSLLKWVGGIEITRLRGGTPWGELDLSLNLELLPGDNWLKSLQGGKLQLHLRVSRSLMLRLLRLGSSYLGDVLSEEEVENRLRRGLIEGYLEHEVERDWFSVDLKYLNQELLLGGKPLTISVHL